MIDEIDSGGGQSIAIDGQMRSYLHPGCIKQDSAAIDCRAFTRIVISLDIEGSKRLNNHTPESRDGRKDVKIEEVRGGKSQDCPGSTCKLTLGARACARENQRSGLHIH